jgi:hypothetical protein
VELRAFFDGMGGMLQLKVSLLITDLGLEEVQTDSPRAATGQ